MIRHLRQADFRTMPWANGAGVTVEMWREEREGRLYRRLSRASVVADGPFSRFNGVERSLTVLSGPGFRLVGEGLRLEALPLVPVAFPGDVAIRAEAVVAASEDFNVMTARGVGQPVVRVCDGGVLRGGGLRAVFALEALKGGGMLVARFELILADEAFGFAGKAIVVCFAD